VEQPHVITAGLHMKPVVLHNSTIKHAHGLFAPQSAINANSVTLLKLEKDVVLVSNTAYSHVHYAVYAHVMLATIVFSTTSIIVKLELVVSKIS
jgi:hypothetical protein